MMVRSGRGRRVGVFGGTFDPPHIGHLVAAIDARQALDLDVVLLMVANVPWQKVGSRTISAAQDRLAMAQAAVADVPGLEVSDLEIRRGGPSYTADTLADLHRAEPDAELFVIVGNDAASGFATWERYEEVAAAATAIAGRRPNRALRPAGSAVRQSRTGVGAPAVANELPDVTPSVPSFANSARFCFAVFLSRIVASPLFSKPSP